MSIVPSSVGWSHILLQADFMCKLKTNEPACASTKSQIKSTNRQEKRFLKIKIFITGQKKVIWSMFEHRASPFCRCLFGEGWEEMLIFFVLT